MNQLFEQPGNSDRLREAGAQWAGDIGNILGDIAGDVSLDKLRTNIEWTGRAAEAYKATVPAQGEALNGLKDLALEMRTSLDGLAQSIDNFWLAMKIAFATFVVAVVAVDVAGGRVLGRVLLLGVSALCCVGCSRCWAACSPAGCSSPPPRTARAR